MIRKNKNNNDLKPFVSIIIIIVVLFSMVFLKIELRSLGYTFLKQIGVYKTLQDNYYLKKIHYARLTSLNNLKKLAKSKLAFRETEQARVIQMTGDNIAIPQ